MRILLTTLATLGAGSLGWLGGVTSQPAPDDLAPRERAATEGPECSAGECDPTVECLPDGTCRIECEGPDGERCWIVLDCDAQGECKVLECGGAPCAPTGCAPAGGACDRR